MKCKGTSIRSHLINPGARVSARFNLGQPDGFWPAFGTRKLKRRERRAPFAIYEMRSSASGQAAFTLVELMVASALALVLATVIAMLAFFSTRSFVVMTNYTEMNQRSQLALDKMSKDIRQARRLTACWTNSLNGRIESLTFANADNNPLSFTYTPSTRKLVRVSGGQTNTLLSDCDALQFWIYQRTMISNSFDCYLPAEVTNARVIQVTWKNSRTILGKKATTENVESSKITLRNR